MNLLDTSIHSTLTSVFGFHGFREGQEAVISKILEGKSALAVFPTGSGKSLCYQLSALHLAGLSLVISPLIALMKDQIDFLQERNIAAARIDGSIELIELRQIDADLRAGRLKLLYVAPERFSNERFIEKLRQLKISLMVIDEAHCISEWGHNFRPDYLKLARTARMLGVERVLALTATATPAVAGDICREFHIEPDAFIHTGFYRPNLTLQITPCRPAEQIDLLRERLKNRTRAPTIVYVTLQRTSEAVAEALVKRGLPARAYHAGMANDERDNVQDWFMDSSDAIVVATIAFGMGIDKSNIRYVYHYNLPKSIENYSQEIGRAGRDGKESICEILACGSDVTVLENFTYGDTPDGASVCAVVDSILALGNEFDISLYDLSRAYDMRPLVVDTLLTYLELADVIESTEPFYNEYQFTPLKPLHDIVARFDASRSEFLRGIFSGAVRARKWYTIDLNATIERLGTRRGRIIKALSYLEEQGDLTLKVAGLRQGYRIKARPEDASALKRSLVQRFETRERNEVDRVRRVIELAEHSGCIVRHLLHHFGENLGRDCGHCSSCSGSSSRTIRGPGEAKTPHLEPRKILALRRQFPTALASPRQISRFFCGLNSPMLTQTKLNKHPDFGSLADVPFHLVFPVTGILCSTSDAVEPTRAEVPPGPGWLQTAVFYQVYPQSFADSNGDGIGDLPGIRTKLDYIHSVGCNAIWIDPIFASPFGDAGYDVEDFYEVAPRYGTNDDLKDLCAEAHKRGMHVCLDLVAGHTSIRNEWFQQSAVEHPNSYSNWYIWTPAAENVPGSQSFPGKHHRLERYLPNFFPFQPALNYGYAQPEPGKPWQRPITDAACIAVREELKKVMKFWLDLGADGFRVDLAASLIRNDPDHQGISALWHDYRAWLDLEYPEAALISEWSDPSVAIPAGFHIDSLLQFREPYRILLGPESRLEGDAREPHAFFERAGGGDIRAFVDDYLRHYAITKTRGYISIPTSNHDTPRPTWGRSERDVRTVFAMLFTMPGVPFIYYGDEIGMKFVPDVPNTEGGTILGSLGEVRRCGSRTPMQWSKGKNAGFSIAPAEKLYLPIDPSESRPDVATEEEDPESLLNFTRTLLKLRREHPALSNTADFQPLFAEKFSYPFVYLRKTGSERIVISINPAERLCVAEVNAIINAVPLLVLDAEFRDGRFEMGPVSFGIFEVAD